MFVINKTRFKRQHDRKGKTMATKEKTVNEVGIIGQMYEDRKSKKVGVLESREPKYKTLMLRDNEGKSFNITYSTFRSNWRKYQGEEVIETSTQKEESRVEEQKEVKEVEKEIKKKSESPKFSTEAKVKAVRALEKFIEEHISTNGANLAIVRNSRGGVIVRNSAKKRMGTAFEVWCKYGIDMYDIFFNYAIAETVDEDEFNSLATMPNVTYTEHETWKLRHGYRVPNTELGAFLDKLINMSKDYFTAKEEQNKAEETEENEKTEEE